LAHGVVGALLQSGKVYRFLPGFSRALMGCAEMPISKLTVGSLPAINYELLWSLSRVHAMTKALQKSGLNGAFSIVLLLTSVLGINNALAEACTYREALMALERGNVDRGLALMRMASRDGDQRAESYLREQDYAQSAFVKDSEGADPPTLATADADFK
jgi:hypothetical protein